MTVHPLATGFEGRRHSWLQVRGFGLIGGSGTGFAPPDAALSSPFVSSMKPAGLAGSAARSASLRLLRCRGPSRRE